MEEKVRREFTVVMRGPSAVVFRQNENLLIQGFPSMLGPVNIAYTSRWIRRSETVTVPGQLWIEIRGEGFTLEESLVPFANAGLNCLSILALSANAAVGESDIEVAFDSSSNVTERDYFQSYVMPESDVVHFARRTECGALRSTRASIFRWLGRVPAATTRNRRRLGTLRKRLCGCDDERATEDDSRCRRF